jgi:hypothetical protein
MFIVKVYDHRECYLSQNIEYPSKPWVLRMSKNRAYTFNTTKSAIRAYKEWYKSEYGFTIKTPVSLSNKVSIEEIQ